MLRRRALLPFLGVVLLSAGVLSACSLVTPHFEKPVLTVVGIDMVNGNLLRQNFLVKLDIQNPNDRPLPVSGLHADLSVAGELIASGVSNRPFVVPPRGDSQFDMTITANMGLALLKLARRSENNADSMDYEVTGVASLDLPFLHELAFHQKGVFNLRF